MLKISTMIIEPTIIPVGKYVALVFIADSIAGIYPQKRHIYFNP